MQAIRQLKHKLTWQSFYLFLCFSALAMATAGRKGAYGLSFGYLMGLLLFCLLAAALEGAVKKGPVGARAAAFGHYALRYLLTFAILLTALLREDMNFFWAFWGLLIPKLLILGGNMVELIRLKAWRA